MNIIAPADGEVFDGHKESLYNKIEAKVINVDGNMLLLKG